MGVHVVAAPGPVRAPASLAGSGLTGGLCHEYRIASGAASGVDRARVDAVEHTIAPGQQLRWAVFPEFDADAPDGFASTSVSVDLALDDGSWLSELGVCDQAGYGITPDAQHGSRALTVDQWNVRTVSLDAAVGRTVVGVHVAAAASVPGDAAGTARVARGWVSDVVVEKAPVTPTSLIDLVDTRRGTHSSGDASRGNTIPAVASPHGFNFAIPVTDASTYTWPYRYHQDNRPDGATSLQAFAISHSPSPWIGDRGVLQFMPVTDATAPNLDREARARTFRHTNETARPHRYRVAFDDGGTAELTATERCVLLRYSAHDGSGLLLDQIDDRGELVFHEGESLITGYTDSRTDRVPSQAPRTYFAIRVDAGFTTERLAAVPARPHVSAVIRPRPTADGTVVVRVATSFISVEQARRTLALEAPLDRSFDECAGDLRSRWEDKLRSFSIADEVHDRLVTFTSSVYRMFLYPNDASENAGTAEHPQWCYADSSAGWAEHGSERTALPVRSGRSFVNNGFWDTYRTVWPAQMLAEPEQAALMLDGFVEHFRQDGWVERWSAPGPVDCMVGTSSDIVIADAVAYGVDLPDLESAYDSALRNATTPSDSAALGRADQHRANFRGYVSTDTPEGLSWTMEGAINDHGIALLSDELLDRLGPEHPRADEFRTNARYFRSRALAYRDLFDADVAFFVGKDTAGVSRTRTEDFDPRVWGGDYTETNAWGMAFSAPHDGQGLAALYGGPAGLRRKLDTFFTTPETGEAAFAGSYGRVIHEMTEARDVRMGMFGLSNQPAHHIPYMYAFTDTPARTQALVRESVRRLFLGSEIGQGYPGDEDNGEMSAWYVFSAMGLYPLEPASGRLLITSPSVRESTIRFPNGRKSTVTALDLTPENVYIQEVSVDGERWDDATVSVERLRAGARIEVRLGPSPSLWPSTPRGDEVPDRLSPRERDLTSPRHAAERGSSSSGDSALFFDDDSSTGRVLNPGDWVAYRLAPGDRPALYTLTLGEPVDAGWIIQTSDDGLSWSDAHTHTAVGFRWPSQTRAFALGGPGVGGWIRLVAGTGSPLDLRQLEFIGASAHACTS